MTRGETVAAPPGFASMCERDDSACGVTTPVMTANAASTSAALSMTTLATSSLGRFLAGRIGRREVRARRGDRRRSRL
jgi:predicted transglutaminase-like cysteine proteinase